MAARKPPETWYWSHDIESDQIGGVVAPGMHLMRLSSYGTGNHRRFAALVFKGPGPERSYALDLDAAAVEARLRETGVRPVAVTVDADGSQRRFSLVLQKGPGPLSNFHVDLDEASVRKLLDDHHGIADFVTYVVDGARKYAVILEEQSGPSWFFTNVTAHELDVRLAELGANLLRVRAYAEDGQRRFAAVAERSSVGKWAWYAGLDADAVASKLDANNAYPFDLDATRDEHGVHFTVVMYRDKP
ncbi:MAG: hypothetical protein ABIT23_08335 [Nitrosospira sp.]